MNKNITLVPVGIVESELVSWLARRLSEVLAQKVVIAEKLPLPSAGYDRRRQQYQGAALMAMLSKRSIVGAERVVGVIGADCYAPGLNFIFGQARMGGREAIVALPRLHQSFDNQPEDTALFRDRWDNLDYSGEKKVDGDTIPALPVQYLESHDESRLMYIITSGKEWGYNKLRQSRTGLDKSPRIFRQKVVI